MADEQGRVVIVDNTGQRHIFPAGFDPRRAAGIVAQQTKAKPEREPGLATIGDQVQAKWSDSLGLNKPTDSRLTGFARGAGGAAVDMVQGASARVQNAVAKSGDPATRRILGAVPVEEQPDVMAAPDTFAGKVGGVLPDVAAMASPMGETVKAGKAAINALPSAERAGEKFKSVMAAAKNVPIDVAETGDVALRIMQLAERGGSMPMAVRKLLTRVTDPEKAAMVYEESRDFASNISRLSADEFGRLTPAVAREVANLRVALNKANAMAAKQVGKMEEYASAMNEYARAMRLRKAVDAAVDGVKKGVPVATAAGVGYWLTQKVRDALGQ